MNDQLLRNAEKSGVYYLAQGHHNTVRNTAQREGLLLLPAEIPACANKNQALLQLGAALHFPSWYGANFDALFDCLTDPAWQPARGHVILVNGLGELRTSVPEDFATLIEVFQAAAETRRETGSPFWILIDTPARGVPAFPSA